MCSEICPPRMSFSSSDLVQPLSPLQSTMNVEADSDEFEFNACTNFDYESSSADELFANGKILPIEPTRHKDGPFSCQKRTYLPTPPAILCSPTAAVILDSEVKLGSNTKSFWGFKRSISLNSNITTNKKSFFSSLPPLLSRSNSTGSVPTQKRTLSKQPSIGIGKSSSVSSSSGLNQKPPLVKKSHGNGGYRVSPVLHVPSPTNLFGFSSLFCNNGKDKKKIRR